MRTTALLALLLVGCAHSTPAPAPSSPPPTPSLLASLERTPCFGVCPVYKVEVFTDGRVHWQGFRNVGQQGAAEAQLTDAQLAQVRDAFAGAKYFELEGNFACRETTDMPSAKTFYSDGTRSKSIDHYYGCESPPGVAALKTLEDRLDEVLQTDSRWIHPAQ
ncbi:MAG: DUF6438 domain-containing protein [Myxococcaceae bacterium]